MEKKRVYLSGKITGDPLYREKFAAAAAFLENEGYIVMNPAVLPYPGFGHAEYMEICYAMMEPCEILAQLEDWTSSKGAHAEYLRAREKGMVIAALTRSWKFEPYTYVNAKIETQEEKEHV